MLRKLFGNRPLKVGVFGSAFNPPTLGHKTVIERASKDYDEVWIIPSASHAFGKVMLPLSMRVEMCQAFVNDLNIPNVRLVNCEEQVSDGVVYTIDLLDFLQAKHPDRKFEFLCGADNVELFSSFHKYNEITERHGMKGYSVEKDIRSTKVRNSIEASTPDWMSMVSKGVEKVILANELYQ